MTLLSRWWVWQCSWKPSQVAFVIVWTLLLMMGTAYIYGRFCREHADNQRLQRIFYHDTGYIIK